MCRATDIKKVYHDMSVSVTVTISSLLLLFIGRC